MPVIFFLATDTVDLASIPQCSRGIRLVKQLLSQAAGAGVAGQLLLQEAFGSQPLSKQACLRAAILDANDLGSTRHKVQVEVC